MIDFLFFLYVHVLNYIQTKGIHIMHFLYRILISTEISYCFFLIILGTLNLNMHVFGFNLLVEIYQ